MDTDITHIHTDEGWVYLASVMDLYTRKIIGWKAGEYMTKELVIEALDQAYKRQKPNKGSVLHHSDRGSQYASVDYQDRLKMYEIKSSMSRKGNCYDNACIESFHSVLKKKSIGYFMPDQYERITVKLCNFLDSLCPIY